MNLTIGHLIEHLKVMKLLSSVNLKKNIETVE